MLLLGRAILAADSEGGLTRDGILTRLTSMDLEKGAFLPYTFNNGENVRHQYSLYSSPLADHKSDNDFQFERVITGDELDQYSQPIAP